MPATPISHQGWPLGASACSAEMGFALASRPSEISAIITGRPTSKVASKYTSKKPAPPLAPVRYGNFQILPRPTAEPRVAASTPNPVVKPARFRPGVGCAICPIFLSGMGRTQPQGKFLQRRNATGFGALTPALQVQGQLL